MPCFGGATAVLVASDGLARRGPSPPGADHRLWRRNDPSKPHHRRCPDLLDLPISGAAARPSRMARGTTPSAMQTPPRSTTATRNITVLRSLEDAGLAAAARAGLSCASMTSRYDGDFPLEHQWRSGWDLARPASAGGMTHVIEAGQVLDPGPARPAATGQPLRSRLRQWQRRHDVGTGSSLILEG